MAMWKELLTDLFLQISTFVIRIHIWIYIKYKLIFLLSHDSRF